MDLAHDVLCLSGVLLRLGLLRSRTMCAILCDRVETVSRTRRINVICCDVPHALASFLLRIVPRDLIAESGERLDRRQSNLTLRRRMRQKSVRWVSISPTPELEQGLGSQACNGHSNPIIDGLPTNCSGLFTTYTCSSWCRCS